MQATKDSLFTTAQYVNTLDRTLLVKPVAIKKTSIRQSAMEK